ncbi:hypothetical protein SAMN05216412_101333 [Nitrosospira multiformis]|uniref:Uncharacterized protein n=1 Tax=Nitrosospira multiformis TaxID=1231 RepID=A0A1H9YRL7_9PROT|nr:hypothetical protein [Nitrosospira multiformis]SES71167.1 hypothetical protein SAMN05216412_101333 [Nitrosospira multiformis]
MAKKSSASLSVVPPRVATPLSPPTTLTARQKELWKEIVLSKPAAWFDRANAPLLCGYVKSIASHEFLTSQADSLEAELVDGGGDLKTLNRLHGMIERQARLIQTFATKPRLTQQSRYTAATAAVVANKASGARPWDDVE